MDFQLSSPLLPVAGRIAEGRKVKENGQCHIQTTAISLESPGTLRMLKYPGATSAAFTLRDFLPQGEAKKTEAVHKN